MNSKTGILQKLWAKQQIGSNDVDYNLWGQKREFLRQMANMSHSCLFTVDVFKGRYDFASSGFSDLFGYKPKLLNSIEKQGDFFEDMSHPDDLEKLIKMQIDHSRFIYSLAPQNRNDYSNTYKFRMRNSQKKYLNVMSRQRVIQQDANGKAWIILGEVNILPDQRLLDDVQGITVNLKTGQIIHPRNNVDNDTSLSEREIEILKLVQSGFLSKEIADKLCISLNTVNNHRKNILRKLQVANSIEAINAAFKNNYSETV
jgi:DNA-binding CsgD family transcriptional regulator